MSRLVYGVLLSHLVDPGSQVVSLGGRHIHHCVISPSPWPRLLILLLKYSEVLDTWGQNEHQLGLLAKTTKSKTLITFKSGGTFGIFVTLCLSPRVWDEITLVKADVRMSD